MSIKLMAKIFDSPEPRGTNRLILLALADSANDAGVCWPGLETIAKKAAVSRITVIRALADLEEGGFIERKRRANRSNLYVIRGYQIDTSITDDTSGSITVDTSRGITDDTRTVINHKIEPPPAERVLSDDAKKALQLYEQNIGPLTPIISDTLIEAVPEYTLAWIEEAIKISVTNGKRSMAYVKAILKRWKTEGRKEDKAPVADRTHKIKMYER